MGVWIWGDFDSDNKKDLEEKLAEAAAEHVMEFRAPGFLPGVRGTGKFQPHNIEVTVRLVRDKALDNDVDQEGQWTGEYSDPE